MRNSRCKEYPDLNDVASDTTFYGRKDALIHLTIRSGHDYHHPSGDRILQVTSMPPSINSYAQISVYSYVLLMILKFTFYLELLSLSEYSILLRKNTAEALTFPSQSSSPRYQNSPVNIRTPSRRSSVIQLSYSV